MMKTYDMPAFLVVILYREIGIISASLADQVYSSYSANQSLHDNFHDILGSICPQSVYCDGEHRVPNATNSHLSDTVKAAREDLKGVRDELLGCCQPCSCEADCQLTNNCCIDAQPAEILSVAEGSQRCLQANIDQYRSNGAGHLNANFYFMVTKCPYTTTEVNMTKKCESPNIEYFDEVIPVQSDVTRLIYRNIFCAQCNGVMNFTDWQAYAYIAPQLLNFYGEIIFKDFSKLYSIIISASARGARLLFHPPGGVNAIARNRPCFDITMLKCKEAVHPTDSSLFIEAACSYKMSVFTENYLPYTNIFCRLCTDNTPLLAETNGGCGSLEVKGPGSMIGMLIGSTTTDNRGILDKELEVPREPTMNHLNCTCQEWYDETKNECRPMKCAIGYDYISCQCIKIIDEIFGVPVMTVLRMRQIDSSTTWTAEESQETDISLVVIQAVDRTLKKNVQASIWTLPYFMFRHIQNGFPFYDQLIEFTVREGADTRDVVKSLFYKLQDGLMVRAKGMKFEMKLAPFGLISIYKKIQLVKRPVQFDPQMFKGFAENISLMYVTETLFHQIPDKLVLSRRFYCNSIAINEEELSFINSTLKSYQSDYDIVLSLSYDKNSTFICFDDFISVFRPMVSRAPSYIWCSVQYQLFICLIVWNYLIISVTKATSFRHFQKKLNVN